MALMPVVRSELLFPLGHVLWSSRFTRALSGDVMLVEGASAGLNAVKALHALIRRQQVLAMSCRGVTDRGIDLSQQRHRPTRNPNCAHHPC